MAHRVLLGTLLVVLVAVMFFAPAYGWEIRRFLTLDASSPAIGASTGDTPNLTAENDALKAQLASLQTVESQLPQSAPNELRAMVYSRYPFNFKNEMLVNAGSLDGVATGSAVLYEGMLIGRVTKAFSHEAIVQTVFDNGFTMPVRVGNGGYDGLFEGGSYPEVGSVAKTANVQTGDVVYAAAPGLPYGLPLGAIISTSTSADSLFTQALVTFPYDVNDIQTVLITKAQ